MSLSCHKICWCSLFFFRNGANVHVPIAKFSFLRAKVLSLPRTFTWNLILPSFAFTFFIINPIRPLSFFPVSLFRPLMRTRSPASISLSSSCWVGTNYETTITRGNGHYQSKQKHTHTHTHIEHVEIDKAYQCPTSMSKSVHSKIMS